MQTDQGTIVLLLPELLLLLAAAKRPTYLSPADGEAAGTRFPYALAIALGTLVELWRTGAL